MLNRFVAEISRLTSAQPTFLLAVSAGVDSMAMLHLFSKGGYNFAVAHCNFQLRGSASEEDEKLVKKTCKALNIPFHTTRFHTNNYAAANSLSVQMAARELRYTWFRQLMQQHHYQWLATAHHLNDNLETTLLNFVRGTGISGVRGIPPVNSNIIRPLLAFSKAELVAYATAQRIAWREDASNASEDYDRNFLRYQVIPHLQLLNPALEETFKRSNQRLLGAEAIFLLGLQHLKRTYVREAGGNLYIDKALLQQTPYPEVVVWELLKTYGFNYSQCRDAVEAQDTGKQFLSPTHLLLIDRHEWIVAPAPQQQHAVVIDKDVAQVAFNHLELTCTHTSDTTISNNPNTAQLDAGKITFPITWRRWQEGDAFVPLGMTQQKKLSDFFIDKKVPRTDKARATVLEAGGEILWVVGYRIDNRYKITDNTTQILQFTLRSHL